MQVAGYLVRRVAASLLTLVIASVVSFGISEILPGNAATANLGRDATAEQVRLLEQRLHLDEPATERYYHWATAALRGDLGTSTRNDHSVAANIATPLRNSLLLAAVAACVGIPFWVLLGALAALWRGRTLDVMITGAVLTGVAVPEFVVGTLLILGLAIGAGLFPAVTAVSPNAPLVMFIPALTLPALTLVIGNAAYVTRTTRTGLIAALESESVAAANLRGLDPRRVLLRHAFPQAMGSTLNAAALTVGSFLGGIVVVESLFNYPGLGTLAVNAAANHDLPELQAVTLLGAAAWIVVSLLADAAGVLVNPRLREAAA